MTTDNAKLKQAVYHEIGCDAEDLAESARRQIAEHRGAKAALRRSAVSLKTIAARADQDLDGGVLAEHGELAQKVCEYAKIMIQRCTDSVVNAARHEETCETSASGGLQAATKMVDRLKKKHDQQSDKVEQLEAAVESGDVSKDADGDLVANGRKRPVGVRPGKSVAQTRKAPAKKKPAKKKGTASGDNA